MDGCGHLVQQCILGKGLALGLAGLSTAARRQLHFLLQETGLRHPSNHCYRISPPTSSIKRPESSLLLQRGTRILGRHLNCVNGLGGEITRQSQKVRTLNDQRLTAATRGNLPLRSFLQGLTRTFGGFKCD